MYLLHDRGLKDATNVGGTTLAHVHDDALVGVALRVSDLGLLGSVTLTTAFVYHMCSTHYGAISIRA